VASRNERAEQSYLRQLQSRGAELT
jgi:hypothetical protein